MGTAEAIKLGMTALVMLFQIILEIVKAKDSGEAPQLGGHVAELLGQIGNAGKIKELNSVDVASMAPVFQEMFGIIHDLIEKVKEDKPAA